MDFATCKIKQIIKEKGISIASIGRNTNIPINALYSSLGDGETNNRPLKAFELLEICAYTNIEPMGLITKETA